MTPLFDRSRFLPVVHFVLLLYCLVKVDSECSTFMNLSKVGKIGEILYLLSENGEINRHKNIEY